MQTTVTIKTLATLTKILKSLNGIKVNLGKEWVQELMI